MTTLRDPRYAGYRYLAEVIVTAVWLYFRFPLSMRMVEEMLAARGVLVSHETVRQWGLKFGRDITDQLHRRAPRRGDKWHLDEVVLSIAGKKQYLFGTAVKHRTSKFKNNHLEQDHRGVKGRTRPMRGFQNPDSAHRFCRAYDEVRNFLRTATRRKQHVPTARRRAIHVQRVAALRDMLAVA